MQRDKATSRRIGLRIQSHSSVHTLFFLAEVCSTAVRNPVGKVNPESQKSTGG